MKKSEKAKVKRNEILDIAEGLFIAKGYEHTTINDILNASGIAKGSLYYYFKSKEDVLDGLIKRRGDEYIAAAGAIASAGLDGEGGVSVLGVLGEAAGAIASAEPEGPVGMGAHGGPEAPARMGAQEKLIGVIMSLQPKGEPQKQLMDDLEKSSNGQMFLKSLTDIVLRLAPIIQVIIEQGIEEGVFATAFPLESAEILLAAAHALFDNGDFVWTREEEAKKLYAFITAAERVLGAAEGSLTKLVLQ